MIECERRVELGLSPSEESEYKFLKKIRDNVNFYELSQKRKKEEYFVKHVKPFYIKTTALNRVDAYKSKIGLPKPYHKQGPLIPSETHQPFRFYKKERMHNYIDKA